MSSTGIVGPGGFLRSAQSCQTFQEASEHMASIYWTSLRQLQLSEVGPLLQSIIHAHTSPELLTRHDNGFPLLCGSMLVMCGEQIQRAARKQGFLFEAKILEALMTSSNLQQIQTFMKIEPKWLFQKLREVVSTSVEQQSTNFANFREAATGAAKSVEQKRVNLEEQLKNLHLAQGDLLALLLLQGGQDILNRLLDLFRAETVEEEDLQQVAKDLQKVAEDIQEQKTKLEERKKQLRELREDLQLKVEEWLLKPEARFAVGGPLNV